VAGSEVGGGRIFVIFVGERLGVRTSGRERGVRRGRKARARNLRGVHSFPVQKLRRAGGSNLCAGKPARGRKAGVVNLGGVVISGWGGAGRLEGWNGRGVGGARHGGLGVGEAAEFSAL
jgi:hypothetical protein